MKTIIASSASFTAVLASYFSISTTIQPLTEDLSSIFNRGVTATHVAEFCPVDSRIMNRDFREEGVVSKIKVQSVKTSIFVNFEDPTSSAE